MQRLPFKLRLLGAAALLVCLLFSTLWLLSPRPKEPPPIVIFPPHYTVPAQKGPLLERWIPFSWSMYWRLREKVVGKKKVITLRISVYDLDSAGLEPATASEPVAELASLLAKPDLTAHGVRVWLLPGAAVKKIQSTLRRLPGTESNVMGITTADGMQAVLSTGNNNAMTIMSVLPVLRRDKIDLTATITSTQSGQTSAVPQPASILHTNISVGVRVQLPKDISCLVFDTSHQQIDGKVAGFLVTAELDPPKATTPNTPPAKQ